MKSDENSRFELVIVNHYIGEEYFSILHTVGPGSPGMYMKVAVAWAPPYVCQIQNDEPRENHLDDFTCGRKNRDHQGKHGTKKSSQHEKQIMSFYQRKL